jgi:hypothetical protein
MDMILSVVKQLVVVPEETASGIRRIDQRVRIIRKQGRKGDELRPAVRLMVGRADPEY